jgi:hypothetical protein
MKRNVPVRSYERRKAKPASQSVSQSASQPASQAKCSLRVGSRLILACVRGFERAQRSSYGVSDTSTLLVLQTATVRPISKPSNCKNESTTVYRLAGRALSRYLLSWNRFAELCWYRLSVHLQLHHICRCTSRTSTRYLSARASHQSLNSSSTHKLDVRELTFRNSFRNRGGFGSKRCDGAPFHPMFEHFTGNQHSSQT